MSQRGGAGWGVPAVALRLRARWLVRAAGRRVHTLPHRCCFPLPAPPISHNLFLEHASTPTDVYGDATGALGNCCHDRCYNTPHAWQLGWITVGGRAEGRRRRAGTGSTAQHGRRWAAAALGATLRVT